MTELESRDIDLPRTDRKDQIIEDLTSHFDENIEQRLSQEEANQLEGPEEPISSVIEDELRPSRLFDDPVMSDTAVAQETSGEEKGEEGEEGEPQEPLTDDEMALDRERRASSARLNEITHLRDRNRQTTAELKEIKDTLASLQADKLQENALEDIPEELQANPFFKYFNKKFEGQEKRYSEDRDAAAEANQARVEMGQVQEVGQRSAAAYVQHTPDWSAAYQHARQAFSQEQGIPVGPQLDRFELGIIKGWITDPAGARDPAHEIYEYAIQNGFRPGGSGPAPVEDTAPAPQQQKQIRTQRRDNVRRIRNGVDQQTPAQAGGGNRGGSPRGMLSKKQVLATYTKDQLVGLFRKNPDAFDSLMNEGSIDSSLLG